MDWLIAVQRWLYGGMAESMRAASDLSGLPTLMAVAFLFGVVHAFMPGHGKSVLVSYHLGRAGRLIEGVATGTLLATMHVGMAVLFVLAGVAVISRSLAAAGRAPAFETASAALIALIGLYLLVRTIWPPRHQHARDGRMLAVVTGLVPCPLTTFILTYALAKGKLAIGLRRHARKTLSLVLKQHVGLLLAAFHRPVGRLAQSTSATSHSLASRSFSSSCSRRLPGSRCS